MKKRLTDEQWAEVERRHLIDGEPVRALAREFGVDEGTIRKRLNPRNSAAENGKNVPKSLKALVVEQVDAERTIKRISAAVSEMPMVRQETYRDLRRSYAAISEQMASAAEYAAANTHRLMGIAHMKVADIDDAAPLGEESRQALKDIAALTALANESSKIPLNLLAANKEAFSVTPASEDGETTNYIVAPDVAESMEAWSSKARPPEDE